MTESAAETAITQAPLDVTQAFAAGYAQLISAFSQIAPVAENIPDFKAARDAGGAAMQQSFVSGFSPELKLTFLKALENNHTTAEGALPVPEQVWANGAEHVAQVANAVSAVPVEHHAALLTHLGVTDLTSPEGQAQFNAALFNLATKKPEAEKLNAFVAGLQPVEVVNAVAPVAVVMKKPEVLMDSFTAPAAAATPTVAPVAANIDEALAALLNKIMPALNGKEAEIDANYASALRRLHPTVLKDLDAANILGDLQTLQSYSPTDIRDIVGNAARSTGITKEVSSLAPDEVVGLLNVLHPIPSLSMKLAMAANTPAASAAGGHACSGAACVHCGDEKKPQTTATSQPAVAGVQLPYKVPAPGPYTQVVQKSAPSSAALVMS